MSNPPPLQAGLYYHIYNRGNNGENLFREERNYRHFMHLHVKYIDPVAETYAYCLLKNHFHMLIRVRDPKGGGGPLGSQAFSNFFNAYSKMMNLAYGRTGSLFEHPFRRIVVASQSHLLRLVTYIHQNPQKHGFVTDFRDWPWSSYHLFLCPDGDSPQCQAVLDWFGGHQALRRAHATITSLEMTIWEPKGE